MGAFLFFFVDNPIEISNFNITRRVLLETLFLIELIIKKNIQ